MYRDSSPFPTLFLFERVGWVLGYLRLLSENLLPIETSVILIN